MTPEELHAFVAGIVIGTGLGLSLGLWLLPTVVDVWYGVVRLIRRRRER
jgi:hypothetical protein